MALSLFTPSSLSQKVSPPQRFHLGVEETTFSIIGTGRLFGERESDIMVLGSRPLFPFQPVLGHGCGMAVAAVCNGACLSVASSAWPGFMF